MNNHLSLIDTNILVIIIANQIKPLIETDKIFIIDIEALNISKILISPSILEETCNLITLNFGSNKWLKILDLLVFDNFYHLIPNREDDIKSIRTIQNNFPTVWTYNSFKKMNVHKGIGWADAKFILSAKEIYESMNFDKFSILTLDKDLQKALKSKRIGLKDYVIDENLVSKPTYRIKPVK